MADPKTPREIAAELRRVRNSAYQEWEGVRDADAGEPGARGVATAAWDRYQAAEQAYQAFIGDGGPTVVTIQRVVSSLMEGLKGTALEAVLLIAPAGTAASLLKSERENYSDGGPKQVTNSTIGVFTERGMMRPAEERMMMIACYMALKGRSQQLRGPAGEGYCGTCQDFSVISHQGSGRWLVNHDAVQVASPPQVGKPVDVVRGKSKNGLRWLIPADRNVFRCGRCGLFDPDPKLVSDVAGIPPEIAYQMLMADQWKVELETPTPVAKA